MNKQAARFLISFVVGVLVFLLSCLAVWRASPRALMNNLMIDNWSRESLKKVNEQIAIHMKGKGAPPSSLTEIAPAIKNVKFMCSRRGILRNQWPIDGWGRPLLYSVHGTSYTLATLGRDGRRGGIGFDRDSDSGLPLYVGQEGLDRLLREKPPMPTLHDFLFELPSEGMIVSSAISGLIAFLLTFNLVRPSQLKMRLVPHMLVRILVTSAVTIFFAMIIMQFHIPSGH